MCSTGTNNPILYAKIFHHGYTYEIFNKYGINMVSFIAMIENNL